MIRPIHPVLYPLLWLTLLLYLLARLMQLAAQHVSMLHIVLLHVVPAALFAAIHATLTYGRKTAAVFFVICLGTAAASESLSLRTGFPFGHYTFTALMGPKLFDLPILLALAYVGMGYVCWAMAVTLLGSTYQPISGRRILAIPLVASSLMVAWDLAMDPVWSTLQRAWVWRDGGVWFGVPVSNYLGWFLTVFLFYLLFALYLRRHPHQGGTKPRIFAHDLAAVLFYAVSAAGNLLLILLVIIPATSLPAIPTMVTDPSGREWYTAEILSACLLVSLFVMLPPAVLAFVRLYDQRRASIATASGHP